jgi:hypothetical protein
MKVTLGTKNLTAAWTLIQPHGSLAVHAQA